MFADIITKEHMKTIEEKAKAYDEVKNKLSRFIAQGVDPLITRADVQDFFPELAENKDERIRKALKQYFVNSFQNNGVAAICGVHVKDVLDWLEKQGQVKESTISQHENRTCEENGNSLTCEDERIRVEENKGNIGGISPNWSEEDERLCQCLIEDQEEFLDRVSNDKYGHSEIISDLKEMYHERIDWLKSLRPQNRWKPSELQLGCLSDAIEHYNSLGYPASKLKELLDDLKKIKEGKV